MRRMIRRNWVIRAVPAAAIARAPKMAARSSATASDRRRCAPRKLMFTACAFWMMKIITTARAATPVIRPVRIPLIRVRAGRREGAGGAGGFGGGGGAEPLAEGGGSVLVAPCGSGVAVMALLLPEWERAAERLAGSAADPGWACRLRLLVSRCPTFTVPMKNETSNLFPEILI